MSHEVETMFYTREKPWHGLGERVEEALNSSDALKISGLDWKVDQRPIYTVEGDLIKGYKANVRSTDEKVLGVLTERYTVVQNQEAFAFTDALINQGLKYEVAGSLQEGRRIWLLARLPENYRVSGDDVNSYLVFTNAHDGSGGIKVSMTPIRVVCQNTLNLALKNAKRIWSTIHVGNLNDKIIEARQTILNAEQYTANFKAEAEQMSQIKLTDKKVMKYIEQLIPMPDNETNLQRNNINRLRDDLAFRYTDAPDLVYIPKSSWRFINAVADFATHSKPLRNTSSFQENMFRKTIDGNPLIDKAYELVRSA